MVMSVVWFWVIDNEYENLEKIPSVEFAITNSDTAKGFY